MAAVLIPACAAGALSPPEAELRELLASARPLPGAAATATSPPSPARVGWYEDGHLRYAGAPEGYYFPEPGAVAGHPEATAARFLERHAPLFGVRLPAVEFRLLKLKHHQARTYARLQQYCRGVPVFAAQVTIQLSADDQVDAVFCDVERDATLLDSATLSTIPAITAAQAAANARTATSADSPGAVFETSSPKLCIFSPLVVGDSGAPRLAWDLDIRSVAGPPLHRRMLMDAQGGGVLFEYPLSHSALNRRIMDDLTYNAVTNQDGSVTKTFPPVRLEGDPPSTNAQANLAYDGIGDAYQFYLNEHGRNYWLTAYEQDQRAWVRYCPAGVCPWANAVFESAANEMEFGDGWAVDDVVAHEYTHGVTAYESGLIYRNASGAINESFSDCWGEFVDLTNGRGNDAPGVRWEVGEDLPGGPIRSMSNPPLFNNPDRLSSHYYFPPPATPSESNDWGGVHCNSGVNNKLCFLLTDGGTFNGSTVTGLGISRIADLYYEANANLLQAGADWTDLYNALRQAAVNLRWTSQEQNNLYRACRAVEIGPVSDLYVDKTSSCPVPAGAQTCNGLTGPYLSVRQGATNALAGDTVHIRSEHYNETLTISNRMTLQPYSGAVTIGKP